MKKFTLLVASALVTLGLSAQMSLPTELVTKQNKFKKAGSENVAVRPMGVQTDGDYSWEPTEVTTQNYTGTAGEVGYYADGLGEGFDVYTLSIQGTDFVASFYIYAPLNSPSDIAAGTYPIMANATAGQAPASPGGDAYQDYPCFVGTTFGDGGYTEAYYLVSGNIVVSAAVDGAQTVTVSATSYNGSTINITGSVTPPNPDDAYAFEPTTPTVMNLTASECMMAHYADPEGEGKDIYVVMMGDATPTFQTMMYVYAGLNSPANGVPVGTYPINDTKAVNTVLASPGGDDTQDFPSYMATAFSASGYSEAYYLMSGNLVVGLDGADTTMTLNATTYFGSTININYTQTSTGTEINEVNDFSVYAQNGEILVSAAEGASIEVYSVTGARLFSTIATSDFTTINDMPKGIAVVSVNGKATKVML